MPQVPYERSMPTHRSDPFDAAGGAGTPPVVVPRDQVTNVTAPVTIKVPAQIRSRLIQAVRRIFRPSFS